MNGIGRGPGQYEDFDECYSVNPVTGCHEWERALTVSGYGRKRDGKGRTGKTRRAHHIAWERENGPIPSGLILRHKCDNRKCVNVEHLETGTHKQNSQDMVARKRGRWDKERNNL